MRRLRARTWARFKQQWATTAKGKLTAGFIPELKELARNAVYRQTSGPADHWPWKLQSLPLTNSEGRERQMRLVRTGRKRGARQGTGEGRVKVVQEPAGGNKTGRGRAVMAGKKDREATNRGRRRTEQLEQEMRSANEVTKRTHVGTSLNSGVLARKRQRVASNMLGME